MTVQRSPYHIVIDPIISWEFSNKTKGPTTKTTISLIFHDLMCLCCVSKTINISHSFISLSLSLSVFHWLCQKSVRVKLFDTKFSLYYFFTVCLPWLDKKNNNEKRNVNTNACVKVKINLVEKKERRFCVCVCVLHLRELPFKINIMTLVRYKCEFFYSGDCRLVNRIFIQTPAYFGFTFLSRPQELETRRLALNDLKILGYDESIL